MNAGLHENFVERLRGRLVVKPSPPFHPCIVDIIPAFRPVTFLPLFQMTQTPHLFRSLSTLLFPAVPLCFTLQQTCQCLFDVTIEILQLLLQQSCLPLQLLLSLLLFCLPPLRLRHLLLDVRFMQLPGLFLVLPGLGRGSIGITIGGSAGKVDRSQSLGRVVAMVRAAEQAGRKLRDAHMLVHLSHSIRHFLPCSPLPVKRSPSVRTPFTLIVAVGTSP